MDSIKDRILTWSNIPSLAQYYTEYFVLYKKIPWLCVLFAKRCHAKPSTDHNIMRYKCVCIYFIAQYMFGYIVKRDLESCTKVWDGVSESR